MLTESAVSRLWTSRYFAAAGADGFVSAGFLSAFALLIGASNLHIGILTAIPFISQALQIIAVVAIERLQMRKVR